ncbi:hypothetical protein Tco_1480931 [Tanacetum coccineum]
MPYPEDPIRRIQDKVWKILEDIESGPYSKKHPIQSIVTSLSINPFADGVFVATGNGSDGVSVAAGVGADGVSVTSSPKVHTASAIVEGTSDYAEELARLQGQAYEANSATKDTWITADTVPAGSGVPATSIPAGSINQATGGSAVLLSQKL